MRRACPAGTFGAREASASPACDGVCSAGFFCPEGSNSPQARVCGPKGDPSVFCPAGSSTPTHATPGFYTYGGVASQRYARPFALVDVDENKRIDWLEFSALGPAQVSILCLIAPYLATYLGVFLHNLYIFFLFF